MRRIATGIVLAVVSAIVLAAAVDGIRKAAEPEPARAEPRPRPIEGLTLLSGRLLWTDERCRLHATSLATLQERRRARRVRCDARLMPSGRLERSDLPTRRSSTEGGLRARAGRKGLVLVKDGRRIVLPLTDVRGLAWSPDERWLAAAGAESVYVIRLLNRDLRVRRLPIAATQIAWIRG